MISSMKLRSRRRPIDPATFCIDESQLNGKMLSCRQLNRQLFGPRRIHVLKSACTRAKRPSAAVLSVAVSWCSMNKWQRKAIDKFWRLVYKSEKCWIWLGHRDPKDGYGKYTFSNPTRTHKTQNATAHRFSQSESPLITIVFSSIS